MESSTEKKTESQCAIPQRYVLAILLLFGSISVSLVRNSINVAVLDMVNNGTTANFSENEEYFDWDIKQETFFLGSYMYGYAPMNAFGALLARKYGVKHTYGLAVLLSSIVHVITPQLIITNFYLGITCRVIIGAIHGVIHAAAAEAWVHWAPTFETSTLTTIAMSGVSFGSAVSNSLLAYITQYYGWKWNFYISGVFGIVWFVPFYILASNRPNENRWITKAELKYITENTTKRNSKKKHAVPFRKILTSMPVLAIFAIHFCDNFSLYASTTLLPTYIFNIYGFSITKSGLLLTLPYALVLVTGTIAARITDVIRAKQLFRTITTRRINSIIGSVCLSILVLLSSYSSNVALSITLITISISMTGVSMSGYLTNPIDIAPQFNAIIFGISNALASLPGFLGPQIAGLIITDKTSLVKWRTWFWIASAINMSGLLFYCVFSSSTKLEWAEKYEEHDENNNHNDEKKAMVM